MYSKLHYESKNICMYITEKKGANNICLELISLLKFLKWYFLIKCSN